MKLITLSLMATILCVNMALSQTVTTFTDGTPDDGIAVDNLGNIYCAHYLGDTVFKFTPTGEMTSFITGLNTPNGLAFNSSQELYVCDGQGQMIYKYDINGNQLASYPITGNPSGIIKSFEDDSMIFTIHTNNSIHKLAPDGTITDISLAPELNTPVGLAMDENGTIYVGNYSNRKIYRVLQSGTVEYIAQLPTDGGALPNLGFITYGQGKIWGTTMGSDKIYYVNPNGVDDYTLFAGSTQGSDDGDISTATFNTPNGIYFNEADGTIYITDFGTKNLRIISGVLSISDPIVKKNEIQLFPNPVSDILNIKTELSTASIYSMTIYDLLGRIKYSSEEHPVTNLLLNSIDVSSFENGTYFMKLDSEGKTATERFIKE